MSERDLYVQSVEGHLVTRFGTGRTVGGVPMPGLLIGAERDQRDPTVVRYSRRIVHIPADEAIRYATEYARAIRDKALVQRTRAEFEMQPAEQPEAQPAAQPKEAP